MTCTYLIGSSIGDINPGLGSIMPEDTHSLTPAVGGKPAFSRRSHHTEFVNLLVGQHEWDGAIECHPVVEFIFKHIKIVQTIGVPITEMCVCIYTCVRECVCETSVCVCVCTCTCIRMYANLCMRTSLIAQYKHD